MDEALEKGDYAALLQVKMLEMLEGRGGRGSGRHAHGRHSSESTSSSGSSDVGGGDRDKRKTDFKSIHRRRKKFQRRPAHFWRRYRRRVLERLGVTHERRQHWTFQEYAKLQKGRFGHMQGLYRVYHHLHTVLQYCEEAQWKLVAPFLATLAQGILQAVLDDGKWHNAALLIPVQDPLEVDAWAGEPEDLEDVFQYRRAMHKLRTRLVAIPGESNSGASGGGRGAAAANNG